MKDAAEVVFVGTVFSTGAGTNGLWRYTFRVEELFAGPSTKEIDIYSSIGCCACGMSFRVGERYLVDGWRRKDGLISTGFCDKTRLLDTSDPLLTELRAVRDGKKPDSLFGTLKRVLGPGDVPESNGLPLSGVTIRVHSDTEEFETKSDSDGHYRFRELAPGRYSVSADLPGGVVLGDPILKRPIRPFSVATNACGEFNIGVFTAVPVSAKSPPRD
jgi:hypothetical protein